MICPACREEMIVIEYNKIELDVCVQCKGVWFDGGELNEILLGICFSTSRMVNI